MTQVLSGKSPNWRELHFGPEKGNRVAAHQLGRHSIVKPSKSGQETIQETYTDYRQANDLS
jgi:hypothetical protein